MVTRVLILAEVGLYREALAGALEGDRRIEVVGVAASLEEALTAIETDDFEVLLVDTLLQAGVDGVRTLAGTAPEVKVVAVGVPVVEGDVVALAEAGASGYVAREGSIDDVVAAAESVSRDEALCSPEVAAMLFHRVADLSRDRALEPIEKELTARELDVLRLIEEGRSNKEIASALSIEVPTVKNHVHSILQKLGVHCRTEAAARARRHGLPRLGKD